MMFPSNIDTPTTICHCIGIEDIAISHITCYLNCPLHLSSTLCQDTGLPEHSLHLTGVVHRNQKTIFFIVVERRACKCENVNKCNVD